MTRHLVRPLLIVCATASLASAQWIQRNPTTVPAARVAAGMDFVPANAGLVMFGGSGSAPLINNQTWVYNGIDWTQLAPAASPTARFGAQLVYDAARGVAVLYGGLASAISIPPPTSETWEWNGVTWTQATPAANAGPRYRYAACYDSLRSRVVIYGGATTQLLTVPNNQTWEYQGTTWSLATTNGNPGPRDRAAMCFHAGFGKAVLFGGYDGVSLSNQTWIYDGVAGTWNQVVATGPVPAGRNAATLVYDAQRGVCVLTGGQDANGPLTDTWTFDGVRWLQQPTTTQAVRDHMAAYLPTIAHVVKFGGFHAAPNTLSNETWEIGTGIYGLGCPGSNGVPSLVAGTAPQFGQSWTITVANLNPALNFAVLSLGLTQLAGIDLGPLLGMSGCTAYTTPDLMFTLSGAAGSASWTWPVVQPFFGLPLHAQALALDPTVNGFGFTASNAVYATIAY